MIKFKELSRGRAECVGHVLSEAPSAERCEVEEIIDSFYDMEEDADVSVAFTAFAECLLARIFDMGRYMFVYPIALTESASEDEALEMIRAYAIKEEIPLCLCDVPAECLGALVSAFRHVSADAEDPERSSYRVEVHGECALLDEPPAFDFGELVIDGIEDSDSADYAELCRSREVNRFWGYDYREDVKCPSDDYFVTAAAADFARGTALCLAVRREGRLIGELSYYAFDLKGASEVSFRILPAYQGAGLGRKIMESSLKVARAIGLTELRATIMEENVRSVALVSSVMEECGRSEGKIHFRISL